MREIKYRIWDEIKKKYVEEYDDFFINPDGDLYIIDSYEGTTKWCKPDRYVVEQYTGLKDKNGKEIYEGDILQWREVYDNGEELSLENYEVIHKDGGFHIKNIKGNFPRFEPISEILSFLYCFKVIGNVYENPQLLKAVE